MSVETLLVVALAFAVFSACTAVGSCFVLGVGFERLRAGFEIVRKQTAYFSDAIFSLDKRVETVEAGIVGAGGADTKRAESLVRHAENLLAELGHIARGMKDQKPQDDGLAALADSEDDEEDLTPATIDITGATLPPTVSAYFSSWGDLGIDGGKQRVTLM